MAQSKDDKKASKNIARPMAKVQKDEGGYKVIGKTSKKVIHNQNKGKKYTYYIVSVDAQGNRSSPAIVVIN